MSDFHTRRLSRLVLAWEETVNELISQTANRGDLPTKVQQEGYLTGDLWKLREHLGLPPVDFDDGKTPAEQAREFLNAYADVTGQTVPDNSVVVTVVPTGRNTHRVLDENGDDISLIHILEILGQSVDRTRLRIEKVSS